MGTSVDGFGDIRTVRYEAEQTAVHLTLYKLDSRLTVAPAVSNQYGQISSVFFSNDRDKGGPEMSVKVYQNERFQTASIVTTSETTHSIHRVLVSLHICILLCNYVGTCSP